MSLEILVNEVRSVISCRGAVKLGYALYPRKQTFTSTVCASA